MNEEQMERLIKVLSEMVMALVVFAALLIVGFVVALAGINQVMTTLERMAS